MAAGLPRLYQACPGEPREGKAAPTAFVITEASARRDGRPYPLVRA
jgi:hypothetical protein